MLLSIAGIYRRGQVELSAILPEFKDEARVIVTFLEPRLLDLRARGLTAEQAAELRGALPAEAADWNSPDMAAYADYDAARARLIEVDACT